jgi:hypothetical protein
MNGPFWDRVDTTGGIFACWPWVGCLDSHGYGKVRHERRQMSASRKAWILTNGPVPAGLFVCHTCDNPPCCNPLHLFLGTAADNNADMMAKGRQIPGRSTAARARRSTCLYGHPFTTANTIEDRWGRHCRTCKYAGERARRASRRAA